MASLRHLCYGIGAATRGVEAEKKGLESPIDLCSDVQCGSVFSVKE